MPAATCAESASRRRRVFAKCDYDLAATLSSGQAFRWERTASGWHGVIGERWVHLREGETAIEVQTAVDVTDWQWVTDYLQLHVELGPVLASFPCDEPMRQATAACRGLRLLRQDPWECLASFILSSTKQIVQIQQIVRLLCQRYGEPIASLSGREGHYRFPTARQLAALSEAQLRECKMGFRAPYLRTTATAISEGKLDLEALRQLPTDVARSSLIELPGVGRKIADCVLLFAYGRQDAFPVDVWVRKGLKELYFRRRRVTPKKLEQFSATYFGPNAGYAQQYLFHYMRTRGRAADAK